MARRTEAQSIIVIIKAVRAFPRAASVDTEALIAELRDAKRLNTVTHEEVLALLEERFPEVEVLDAEEAEARDAWTKLNDTVRATFGSSLPSTKRMLVAYAAAFLAGAGIGFVGGHIMTWLIAGAMLLGMGSFVVMLISLLSWIAMFIASYVAGKKVGAYILTGTVDEHVEIVKNTARNAWGKVTGFFDNSVTA